ncbi:MAG: hypothetical protein [Caudoviricetes sp.]|nr:MAG: hypothetical protein [Caudoviricetes sp.]
MNIEQLYYWYYCDDCHTEWERLFVEGRSMDGGSCSYCGSNNTRFIGWADND